MTNAMTAAMTAALHSVLVLFRKTGENWTTPADPQGAWTGQVDLDTQERFCMSSDDNRLVTGDLFEVREVTLPAWLSADEWARDAVGWKYLWGAGVEMTWPEAWQRALMGVSFAERYWLCQILRVKKFRSEFRRSLFNQIVSWMETPEEYRRFPRPLSPRQMGCLARNAWEPQRAQNGLYWDRSWPSRRLSKEEALAAVEPRGVIDAEFCDADGTEPPAGSWAATARAMAAGDESGFDWDTWKDEMKEGGLA